ncbi:MAG: hypothetical protein WBA51_06060 [Erythrobacter sp.]
MKYRHSRAIVMASALLALSACEVPEGPSEGDPPMPEDTGGLMVDDSGRVGDVPPPVDIEQADDASSAEARAIESAADAQPTLLPDEVDEAETDAMEPGDPEN